MQVEFDEDRHVYTVGGEPIPSVTQIISAVCGSSYGNIPQEVLDKAAYRGSCVHTATELYDTNGDGREDWFTYAQRVKEDSGEDIEPRVQAYIEGTRDKKFTMVEKRFYVSGDYPYCGTIDRADATTVYDIKTQSAKDVFKWEKQLTAYALALGLEKATILWIAKSGDGFKLKKIPMEVNKQDWEAILRVFYIVHFEDWKKKINETEII